MVVRACLFLVSWLAVVSVASADDDEKHACVNASTKGQTDRDEGRLIDARGQFLRCVRDTCPAIVKKSCGAWLSALEPRISSIVLRVVDDADVHVKDARVALDGVEVMVDGRAQMLDPGSHTVTVEAPGMEPGTTSFLLSEGEKARAVIVSLSPVPSAVEASSPVTAEAPTPAAEVPAAPAPLREAFRVPTGAWVLGGAGILGLVGFTYFGISSNKKYDELERSCGGACTPEQTEPGRRDAVIANVALGIGVGALIGATAWGLVAWRRARHPVAVTLAPTSGGAAAGLRGVF